MMIWDNFGDFLSMGGYALYVWGSVLVTFGFMFVEVLLLLARRKAISQRLAGDADIDIEDAVEDERLVRRDEDSV